MTVTDVQNMEAMFGVTQIPWDKNSTTEIYLFLPLPPGYLFVLLDLVWLSKCVTMTW